MGPSRPGRRRRAQHIRRVTLAMPTPVTEPRRPALSPREWQVLDLITRPGGSYKTAATALGVSRFTVKQHVHSILRKLNVATTGQAARRLLEAETVPFGIEQMRE